MQGVSKTAIEALSCKQSCSSNEHQGQQKRKSPLLDRVYAARQRVLHHLLPVLLCHCSHHYPHPYQQQHPKGVQLLSLGGGLDVSYDAFSNRHFVVDVEEVIQARKALYQQASVAENPSDRSSFVENREMPRLIACDLNDMQALIRLLEEAGFDPNTPTVIFAECVLSYLTYEAQGKVWSTLASYLKAPSVGLTYDPMLPVPSSSSSSSSSSLSMHGYSQMMREKFDSRKAPLHSAMSNLIHSHTFLYQHNWPHVIALTMQQALQQWIYPMSTDTSNDLEQQSMFDEHAALLLLHSLYSIRITTNNAQLFSSVYSELFPTSSKHSSQLALRMKLAEYRTQALETISSQRNKIASILNDLNDAIA